MPALPLHKDFQAVRYLPFRYPCGCDLLDDHEKDGTTCRPSASVQDAVVFYQPAVAQGDLRARIALVSLLASS